MMTDPLSDMLTRIRNANTALKPRVDIPVSKMNLEIVKIFKEEKYIQDYEFLEEEKTIRVRMDYGPNRERAITGIKRVSKPGLRVYTKADEIPKVLAGLGIAILSTCKGVMTNKEAKKEKIGGEVLCYIW